MSDRRQAVFAILLVLGAVVLLGRTVAMLSGGALGVLVPWAGALLLAEFVLDVAWLVFAVRWLSTRGTGVVGPTLRVAAAAILIHALRVLVFVVGRVGPWIDFDVRPLERAAHPERWTWGEVYFAGTMALLSVIGVGLVWRYRMRTTRMERKSGRA